MGKEITQLFAPVFQYAVRRLTTPFSMFPIFHMSKGFNTALAIEKLPLREKAEKERKNYSMLK